MSLRTLLKMERAKGAFYWGPWSEMLAMYYNSHKEKGVKALKATQINPYVDHRAIEDKEVIRDKGLFFAALKTAFYDRKFKARRRAPRKEQVLEARQILGDNRCPSP